MELLTKAYGSQTLGVQKSSLPLYLSNNNQCKILTTQNKTQNYETF